jgi:6-pyruvoyltetrahydropterin/6-carboxytetrahydropterin synthase
MIESTFDSAHNLRGYQGACESLHGHTYRVKIHYRGEKLDNLGMLVDFKRLKADLADVIDDLDHRYLNELEEFSNQNPTAENVARHIFQKLRSSVGEGISKVTVWETETSAASYTPDD